MQVLITGGSGFIGTALCRALLARGDAVTVLTRSATRVRARLPAAVRCVEDLAQEAPSVLSKPRPRMEGQSMPLRSLDQRGKGRVSESTRRRSLPSFVWGGR